MIILYVLMLLPLTTVHAVIVAGGDGTQNTTAPTGGQGWDYVGRIDHVSSRASVTYLDNNWFITANHVKVLDNPTGVLLGGSPYSIDTGSWTRLTNSVGSDADLMMFRVAESVGLPALGIASSPANGTALTMIGNGRDRATDLTYWNVSGGTWTEAGSPTNAAGYKWEADSTKRWGSNTKEADFGLLDDGFGITDVFYTDFDGIDGEAQGVQFDSGGGIFVDGGTEWELAGLMIAVGGSPGQPAGTSVFGNRTYVADLSTYSGQIADTVAIPEPSVLMLGSVFSIAVFFVRRIFLI
jgi:hypothetical protein